MALRADSYTPDMAALIDRDDEIIADDYGVDLPTARRILRDRLDTARRGQAEMLANVIGLLLASRNMPVMVHSLAIAFGMDQLNGARSQSEIARALGVSRALVSHYVLSWRDGLMGGGVGAFDLRTYRKRNTARKTYAKAATDPILEAKRNKRKK
jgi:hypothetical protein